MPELERTVAGISCREVLADLSDFIDDQLPAERADRIREHLRGCDWCERFGGEFATVVTRFRQALARPGPLDDEVDRRLRDRLRRELDSGRR